MMAEERMYGPAPLSLVVFAAEARAKKAEEQRDRLAAAIEEHRRSLPALSEHAATKRLYRIAREVRDDG